MRSCACMIAWYNPLSTYTEFSLQQQEQIKLMMALSHNKHSSISKNATSHSRSIARQRQAVSVHYPKHQSVGVLVSVYPMTTAIALSAGRCLRGPIETTHDTFRKWSSGSLLP